MKVGKKSTLLVRWIAVGFAGLLYLAAFACNSVLIPIPPPTPNDPSFSQNSSTADWSVSMAPDRDAIGARFYIYNMTLGSGLIQSASPDGSVYARGLQGQTGDPVRIYWQKGTNSSASICRPLGPGLVTQSCQ
jgi:hypothetical protein